MYERFTDRARKAIQLANQEAQRFNHEYVGTEHLLLGLVKEGSGVAAAVLKELEVGLRKARLGVEKVVPSGPDMVTLGRLPAAPGLKRVIDRSVEEARNLGHNYVGTEHLLLGLLRDPECVACRVLVNLGIKLEDLRDYTLDNTRLSASEPPVVVQLGRPLNPFHWTRTQRARARGWVGKVVRPFRTRFRQAAEGESAASAKPDREDRLTRAEARVHALNRQLVTVRFLLGALLGAGAGVSLGDRPGAALGMILGAGTALLGRFIPALLAGAVAGGFVGSAHFAGDGGAVAGAVVGALLAGCVAEVGRTTKS
jgi:hypothetical protein